MICGVGIDIVDLERVAKLIRTYPKQLNRIFTQIELKQVKGKNRHQKAAEIFAAKEAVLKVLGTGWRNGLNWTDVEISSVGSCQAKLKGEAKKLARKLEIAKIQVATSATNKKAVAQAIGLAK